MSGDRDETGAGGADIPAVPAGRRRGAAAGGSGPADAAPAGGEDVVPAAAAAAARIDRHLLELLVCPVTRGPLVYDPERQELISRGAARAYPIVDGIPVMLADGARRLED